MLGGTLRNWIRQAESDKGVRAGPMTVERERIRALEREVSDLRQANEILRKASAYFAWLMTDSGVMVLRPVGAGEVGLGTICGLD